MTMTADLRSKTVKEMNMIQARSSLIYRYNYVHLLCI
jgi:hypothetical protein